jgi:serine phosphatase RsbU (regulator of sigma subunit)
MATPPSAYTAHRCSFDPDRQDLYLRLNAITVFVRDQDRSLRFYVDQLGFSLAFDTRLSNGDRWLAVSPPDGTATLALVAPEPESEKYKLIGRPTQIDFLTEDVFAKFEEWRKRGVRFHHPPETLALGGVSTTFEDADGNSFRLVSFDEMTREVVEQRRAHAERLESERRAAVELEVARKAQAKLFPQTQPMLATLEYAGVCIQARDVGGDYYDFLDLGRERLGLVIGDISGKGTAGALLMANLQAHVHSLSPTYSGRPFIPFALDQPQRLLQALNRLLYENTTESAYATLFFAEYDDRTQRLRYANCGHPPAVLLPGHANLQRLEATCTVLGIFRNWDCVVGERRLAPGDILAVYTDGLTESFNARGEEFGEQRLIEALRRGRNLSPQALLASIVEDIRQFIPREHHDDIALVVARAKEN